MALAPCAASGGASDGETAEEACRRCVIDDDMAEVYELIDAADELVVVSPVYFAGAPAQLKALLDRLQPYFWTDARHGRKRPATLHVVGEGGDPHGFEPLVGVVRSSLSCAGFALERVLDWVGRIDEDGVITAEAVEHALAPLPGQRASSDGGAPVPDDAAKEAASGSVPASASGRNASSAAPSRPALRLSPEGGPVQGGGKAPANGGAHGKQRASGTGAQGPRKPRQGSGQQGNRPSQGSGKQGGKRGGGQGGRPKQGGKRRG